MGFVRMGGGGRGAPGRGACVVLAAGLAVSLAASALGQTTTSWISVLDGDWSDPGNWDSGAPIDDTFNAVIGLGGVYVVSLDAPFTINDFELSAPDATLDLLGNKLTLAGTLDFLGSRVTSNPGGGQLEVFGDALFTDVFLQRTGFTSNGGLIIDSVSGDDICDSDIDHRGAFGVWRGTGDMGFQNNSTFTISEGASFDIENDQRVFWTGIGGEGSFTVEGILTKTLGSGETFFEQVEFTNNGLVRVEAATLRADNVGNVVGTTLAGGRWEIVNGSTLQFDAVSIETNQSDVTLGGLGASFIGFEGVELNDAGGRFALRDGAVFTTGGAQFENLGVLDVGQASRFEVQSGTSLVNFSAGTLSDGEFLIGGILAFEGADITTVASRLVLDGPGSDVVDSGQGGEPSGLVSLATIASGGEFGVVNGRDFTTSGDLTVGATGTLAIGADSKFRVAPGSELTNFSGGTFTGGIFNIRGELMFDNADVERIGADLTLDGPDSLFLNQDGDDGLQNLNLIQPEGRLALLNGRTLETIDTLTVEGELFIGDTNNRGRRGATSLTINGDLVQERGRTALDGGEILVTGVYELLGGELTGDGRITAELISRATISPGDDIGRLSIIGDLIMHADAVFIADISAMNFGNGQEVEADRIDVSGTVAIAPDENGIGGVLDLRLLGNATPEEGTFIKLIGSSGLSGTFETILGSQIDEDLYFKVIYTQNAVAVRVVPAPSSLLVLGAAGLLGRPRRRNP